MLSHPIVLEYIKTYDIVTNFKSLITKSIPSNEKTILNNFGEKLRGLEMFEFNNESTVTPQIVKMTTNVDKTLNEIQVIFTQLIDELITSKFDIYEKDTQLNRIKSRPVSAIRSKTPSNKRPTTPGNILSIQRSLSGKNDPNENIMTDVNTSDQEYRIKKLENDLKEKQRLIDNFHQNELKKSVPENKEQSDLYLLSQKQYPVQDELSIVKENYKDLEKQYMMESENHKNKIG